MRPSVLRCIAFSCLYLLLHVNAHIQAQSPPLSRDESAALNILLDISASGRIELCKQLAENPSIPILAHLCEKSTNNTYQDVAIDAIEKIDAAYGEAVRTLVIGGDTKERFRALETLRDFGFVGKFALPAIQIEAERGQKFLEVMNTDFWSKLDQATLSSIENYKFSMWMMARCDSTSEICDFLLKELEFKVSTDDIYLQRKVEGLLFADGEDSLFRFPQRTEWNAGCFSAINHFAGSSPSLRTKIVERLTQQLESPSPIRQIQSCRSLTTCGAAAEPAITRLLELSNESPDTRIRNTARDAAAMIQGRIEASEIATDGSNFELLVRMLAEGDRSPFRLEALELIMLHHTECYFLAAEMFRSEVAMGHYQRIQVMLDSVKVRNIDPSKLGIMLDLHTTYLQKVEALVIDKLVRNDAKRARESETIISKMELAEDQLKLLLRTFEFDKQLHDCLQLLDSLSSSRDEQQKSICEKIIGILQKEQHPRVQAKLKQLVFLRVRKNLMQYVLNRETGKPTTDLDTSTVNIGKLLALLEQWARSDVEVKPLICDHLFSDLHLLYIGGPGVDTGHLFEPALVELYIETLKTMGDYAIDQARNYRQFAQEAGSEQQYSPQVRNQIARYDQEVMEKLLTN